VILANAGYNTSYIQNQLIGIAFLTKEMSGKIAFVIVCARCINKEVLCSGNIELFSK
jgi:hypothetical protein